MNMKFIPPKGVKVVKKIDWGTVDYIVCATEGYFNDDVKGHCVQCEKKIVWRPYQPKDVPKICLDCAEKLK